MNENTRGVIGTISTILILVGLAFLWDAAPYKQQDKPADLAQGVCAALLTLTASSGWILIAAMPEEKKSKSFLDK